MLAILTPLLALLGVEAGAVTARAKRQILVWGTMSVLGLIAATFLLVAANAGLTLLVGPWGAPLILAGIALVIAAIVYFTAKLLDDAQARRDAEYKKNSEMVALVTTALITAIPFVLKSPAVRQVGMSAGAAIASALMMRKSDKR
ncbi:MAG: hypothetical protein ABI697_01775 [Devosia sp.]